MHDIFPPSLANIVKLLPSCCIHMRGLPGNILQTRRGFLGTRVIDDTLKMQMRRSLLLAAKTLPTGSPFLLTSLRSDSSEVSRKGVRISPLRVVSETAKI